LDTRVTQRGLLDTEATSFVHVPEIGHDPVPGSTFGTDRFYQCPVVVPLAIFLNRYLPEEHAANIQHSTGCAQEAEFSLHDTFDEKLTASTAIPNFEREMIKNIFQLSNLG
jgi:hypothetical protein